MSIEDAVKDINSSPIAKKAFESDPKAYIESNNLPKGSEVDIAQSLGLAPDFASIAKQEAVGDIVMASDDKEKEVVDKTKAGTLSTKQPEISVEDKKNIPTNLEELKVGYTDSTKRWYKWAKKSNSAKMQAAYQLSPILYKHSRSIVGREDKEKFVLNLLEEWNDLIDKNPNEAKKYGNFNLFAKSKIGKV